MPAIKHFQTSTSDPTVCAIGSIAIVPDDANDLIHEVRAITISTPGVLAWQDYEGNSWITADLPSGTYPLFAKRVLVTGTTAAGLTGWI